MDSKENGLTRKPNLIAILVFTEMGIMFTGEKLGSVNLTVMVSSSVLADNRHNVSAAE